MKHLNNLKTLRIAALSVVTAVCFLFTACGKEDASTTSGSGTNNDSEVSVYEPVIVPESEYNYTLSIVQLETDGSSFISGVVGGYNMTHPDKAIEMRDLDLGSHRETQDVAKTLVMADIGNGNGPDILVLSHDYLVDLYEKGKLANIDELFPTLKQELIPSVIKLGTVNGEFVGFIPTIDRIYTCAVPLKYYSGNAWSITDVLDIMDAHPEFKRTFVTRKTVNGYENLSRWKSVYDAFGLYFTDSGFVDYENRKADYCNDEFVRLLERMKKDNENPIDYPMGTGTYLGLYDELGDPISILQLLISLREVSEYAGIPSRNKLGNRFYSSMYIAINKDCKDPDAIREFLKCALYNTSDCWIPTRVYDIGSSLELLHDGQLNYKVPSVFGFSNYFPICDYDGDIVELGSIYEEFMRTLQPLERDQQLSAILTREIQSFIENDIDAEFAAEQIQEKVQEYLDGLE